MNAKQVIVIRTDLNMRTRKIILYGASAAMNALVESKIKWIQTHGAPSRDPLRWLEGSDPVVLAVDSEKELLLLYETARQHGIPCAIVTDGPSKEGTDARYTALAVGPAENDDVDGITGHLQILRT